MSLKNYSHEEVSKMAMVELANLLLSDKNKDVPFKELFDEIAALREFTDNQKATYIAQFYTDLNIDGRFINRGSNSWALKRWYPVDQVIKETKAEAKKKTKAKKKPKPKPKKKPEVEAKEEAETETNEPDSIEELTGDFSKMDGKDDLDEEVEDLAVFAEELDADEGFGDEDLDDEDFDDEDEVDDGEDNERQGK